MLSGAQSAPIFEGPRKISARFQQGEQIELCRLCRRFDGVSSGWEILKANCHRMEVLVGMLHWTKLGIEI